MYAIPPCPLHVSSEIDSAKDKRLSLDSDRTAPDSTAENVEAESTGGPLSDGMQGEYEADICDMEAGAVYQEVNEEDSDGGELEFSFGLDDFN